MFNFGKKKQKNDEKGFNFQQGNNNPPFLGNSGQPNMQPPGNSNEDDDFGDFGDDDMFPNDLPQQPSRVPQAPSRQRQNNPQFRRETQNPMNMAAPSKEEVEEISESVFSEKTDELIKKIDELKDWQKKVISRLDLEEKEIGYLRGNMSNFKTGIVSRIDDMRKDIKTISIEIKVMEKIFSEIMPTFVENIKDLSEIVDKLKIDPSSIKKKSSSRKRK